LGSYTLAVKEEPNAANVLALTVAEGVHEFAESRRALDLEEHLVVVVGDLDVQMLTLPLFWLLLGRLVVGHVDLVRVVVWMGAVCGVRCAVERAGLSGECEWKRSAVGGEDKPIGGEGALYIVRRGEL
jgi:hypothetical protein